MTPWLSVLLLAATAPGQDPQQVFCDVTGHLQGAAGLGEVRVAFWLLQEDSALLLAEGKADAEGAFTFKALPWLADPSWQQKRILLVARAGDRATGLLQITGGRDDLGRLTVPLQPAAEVTGTVRSGDGKPIADATVWLWIAGAPPDDLCFLSGPLPHWQVRTDAEGHYRMRGVPNRKLVLRALHPDCEERREHAAPGTPCDFTMAPGANIEGAVHNPDGSPAVRVQVAALGCTGQRLFRRTQTDDQGRFQIRALEAGKYNVWAESPGLTVVAIESLPLARHETVRGPARPLSSSGREAFAIAADGTFQIIAPPGDNELILRVSPEWNGGRLIVQVADGETKPVEVKVQRKR